MGLHITTQKEKENKPLLFRKTKFSPRIINYAGFDIETHNENRAFTCGSIVFPDGTVLFTKDKKEMKKEFFRRKNRNHIFVATNLMFDFMGLFFGDRIFKHFNIIMRQTSQLISMYTYTDGKHFSKKYNKNYWKVSFIDTMNYAQLSVEKMGKILGIEKLEKPFFLGNKPKSDEEWNYLEAYNRKDSLISLRFMQHFEKMCREELKVTPKLTIASTTLRYFTNHHLENAYLSMPLDVQIDCQNAYYGGRCEATSRGMFRNIRQYDINSMYSYVMQKYEYPDPNTLRTITMEKRDYIFRYHGISLVTIEAPYMKYPLLPLRTKEKLLFPYGVFTSWQSHIELRKALQLGYKIIKIHKMHYFYGSCRPFKSFVEALYPLKQKYTEEKSPKAVIVKLFLNANYGKMGEKWFSKEKIEYVESAGEISNAVDNYERVDKININFIKVRYVTKPKAHHIPIWALYVTAYARLELYKYISAHDPVYYDTDCIITNDYLPESHALGEMKLEHEYDNIIIVRPKMYGAPENRFINEKEVVKVKGSGKKVIYEDFLKLITGTKITYKKPAKLMESLRKGIKPNTNLDIEKLFSCEDTKRYWKYPFDPKLAQESEPVFVNNEIQRMHDNQKILALCNFESPVIHTVKNIKV